MRGLIHISKAQFVGWGCSECDWIFKPAESIFDVQGEVDAWKAEFERQRDRDFKAHICTAKKQKPC
jgi:hypothetical protein